VESFESFVALALAHEQLVVSEAVKFRVTRQTAKASHVETQTHGYEVDLIGARADRLVLATVKSFLGSRGVVAGHVDRSSGTPADHARYVLLNDPVIRDGVLSQACQIYGYTPEQVQFRLYVGRFAAPNTGAHERAVRAWAATQQVGAGPITVHGLEEVAALARTVAASTTYRDSAALTAIKVLAVAGMFTPTPLVPAAADTT